jgi:hypothetical protein
MCRITPPITEMMNSHGDPQEQSWREVIPHGPAKELFAASERRPLSRPALPQKPHVSTRATD